jgi:magnesium transporter
LILSENEDYLCYALIDAIVDHYFIILEDISDKIENLEDELIAEPNTETLQTIYKLKRDMIILRKSVWPHREIVNTLLRGESQLVHEGTLIFLRDLYDHTIQVIDTIESLRDVISGMLDIYLSSSSNRMNEIMKTLTIMAGIFIPLTFIAGIYGMNFEYMPELHSKSNGLAGHVVDRRRHARLLQEAEMVLGVTLQELTG